MRKFKEVLSIIALAIVILACLFLMAWTRVERGCPITQPNCMYIVNQ